MIIDMQVQYDRTVGDLNKHLDEVNSSVAAVELEILSVQSSTLSTIQDLDHRLEEKEDEVRCLQDKMEILTNEMTAMVGSIYDRLSERLEVTLLTADAGRPPLHSRLNMISS